GRCRPRRLSRRRRPASDRRLARALDRRRRLLYTGPFAVAGGTMDVRLATEHEGALLRVTLSAPPTRRLDVAAALEHATERTKLVLFDGAGDDFALGGDVSPAELHALFRRLIALGVPTAAVVRGGCLGAGLELAAFCNFV